MKSLDVVSSKKNELKGLGDGSLVDGFRLTSNTFKIGSATNRNQTFFDVFDPKANLSPKIGVVIDGIIGYDLFKDFVVEINYMKQYIRLYDPENYKYRKCNSCEVFDLEFEKNKPYLNAEIQIKDDLIPVKLLVDSVSGDALWLFEDENKRIVNQKKYFKDFLGYGLSGDIYGRRTKIESFRLKSNVFKNPKVAFLDSLTAALVKKFKNRDGAIGGAILKRFNSIIGYSKGKVVLKKNSNFNDEFSYNKSGLHIEHKGMRLMAMVTLDNAYLNSDRFGSSLKNKKKRNYEFTVKPSYEINKVMEDTPGYLAGLRKGDVIFCINGKNTIDMSLEEVVAYFYNKEGKKIKLEVNRYGVDRTFEFVLKSPMK
ncbi:PDZ domain-containing protein [Olleya sp. Bg11-27]|uniref:PDZ domain-containing protein n=1 Tax=Olleya sp. Bg11-27 TaxID=2058135 RepID=UPI000C307B5A|nr:PDZ domain-containing protein [Olleya sp. Bg11-27]AUC75468.1 signaling protein [Olleya sp. Bg11-27]